MKNSIFDTISPMSGFYNKPDSKAPLLSKLRQKYRSTNNVDDRLLLNTIDHYKTFYFMGQEEDRYAKSLKDKELFEYLKMRQEETFLECL